MVIKRNFGLSFESKWREKSPLVICKDIFTNLHGPMTRSIKFWWKSNALHWLVQTMMQLRELTDRGQHCSGSSTLESWRVARWDCGLGDGRYDLNCPTIPHWLSAWKVKLCKLVGNFGQTVLLAESDVSKCVHVDTIWYAATIIHCRPNRTFTSQQ